MNSLSIDHLMDWIESHKDEWINEFKTFLCFPSISSEPQYAPSVKECALWLTQTLSKLGFEVELWPTQGHPVVFASNLKAGKDKPTLLIYNHYDVQPVDPIDQWKTPPFEPTLSQEKIYARGAQDNKGQCFYVLQAIKLILDKLGKLPLNIKWCIEGEEEMGSSGLSSLLNEKKEALKADFLAIVDLGIPNSSTAAITLGTRGILTLDVSLKASSYDLHSGSHGGIALNPIHALVKILSSLRDDSGKITVPGFYDKVLPLTPEERKQLFFDFDPQEYIKQTGALPIGGEVDYPVLERAWLRPTLEINGIWGGYINEGFKTVIPSTAHAKISCRLVKDQDPEEIGQQLAHALKVAAPLGCEVTVTVHPGKGKAIRVSHESTVVKAFSQAFSEVFHEPCQFIYEGASIPIVPELAEACQGETILLGLGLNTDQIHAPNEHFSIDRLIKGILIMVKAFEKLGG